MNLKQKKNHISVICKNHVEYKVYPGNFLKGSECNRCRLGAKSKTVGYYQNILILL